MLYTDHDENENIPIGKAILTLNNNGFVGTNNGWPMVGQAALFPRSQAIAISTAWNLISFLGEEKVRELFPCPEDVDPEFWKWLFNNRSHDHDQ